MPEAPRPEEDLRRRVNRGRSPRLCLGEVVGGAIGGRMGTPEGREYDWYFRACFPRLTRTVYLMVHDQTLAEDIAQEALYRMLRHWRTVSTYGAGLTIARISVCTWASTVGLVEPPPSSPQWKTTSVPGSACAASRTARVNILPSLAL